MHYGVHPWLSNHGGRQLDGAPSSVETLVDIRKHCPEVFERCDVIVDGGITRGSDIVKAIALGAKGVGLGRPFLYSLVYREAGVSKAIRILKHELETTMALLGVTSLAQLNSSYVSIPINPVKALRLIKLPDRHIATSLCFCQAEIVGVEIYYPLPAH
jgi:L-lactate dehydrogenase (cytochrome)